MKLNPKKVLMEIELLRSQLLNNKKDDFLELHKDVLRFCEEIYSKKNDYKKILMKPNEEVAQIILESFDGKEEEIKIPSDNEILNIKNNLIKDMIEILDEIEKKYLLKQKLME